MKSFDINDIKERLLFKNNLAFSFLAKMPIVPGHILISPIRVVETCEELTWKEWQAIISLKKEVCQALIASLGAEGFNFAWNRGEEAGQTVAHFHLHVVPRKAGDAGIVEYEPRVFLYRPGSRAASTNEELKQMGEFIRSSKR
jgi:diadenosine tetraphosphate (Ap4A) HIT family hydrolase